MKKIIFIILLSLLSLKANEYICSTDQAFQSWITEGVEIDNSNNAQLTKYSNIASCKNNCQKTSECISTAEEGFSCPLYSDNTDLGGDIELNNFSNKETCESSCFKQSNCIAWNDNPRCTPVSFEKLNPISDWTGKTVFTRYHISWECDDTEILYGECLNYETVVLEDNTTFDTSSIGWESREFAGYDEAMSAVAEMEQFQHIWSGWAGMCESGTSFDDSFLSDPMTLLSFATMAYSGALQGAYGEVGGWAAYPVAQVQAELTAAFDTVATSVSNAATAASNAVSNALTGIGDAAANASGSLGFSSQAAGQVASSTSVANSVSAIETAASSGWGQIESFLSTELVGATDYSIAITYGSAAMDIASLAMAAFSTPTDDDLKTADEYMKAQLGATDVSVAAVNYAQCMAAIGLSFPNTMGHAVGAEDAMSIELKEPWRNKIRLSTNQLAHLMNATSESFVRASYIQLERNGDIQVFIAITSLAYQQAGQIICGNGKIALAMNINAQQASDNGGINTEALATQALSTALSYLPPPYNLIASIALKIFTALSSGDACSDEDIAMKWGIQQYKTNKALIGKQCHYIKGECAAKWAWGACMRERKHYCCYDQEMTRIFVEGVKEQIPKGWYVGQCSDLEIKDLKNISFRKCQIGESPVENKCFPAEKWEELNMAIKKQTTKGFDAESLTDMAIDSMPIGDDPWGPRIGD